MMTSIAAILTITFGATWFLIKPHAEEFVKESVKEQFDSLQLRLGSNSELLNTTSKELLATKGQLRDTQTQLQHIAKQNELLIQLLKENRNEEP